MHHPFKQTNCCGSLCSNRQMAKGIVSGIFMPVTKGTSTSTYSWVRVSFHSEFRIAIKRRRASASAADDDYDELVVMHAHPHLPNYQSTHLHPFKPIPIAHHITFWPLDVGHMLDQPSSLRFAIAAWHFYFCYCQQYEGKQLMCMYKTFPTLQIFTELSLYFFFFLSLSVVGQLQLLSLLLWNDCRRS